MPRRLAASGVGDENAVLQLIFQLIPAKIRDLGLFGA